MENAPQVFDRRLRALERRARRLKAERLAWLSGVVAGLLCVPLVVLDKLRLLPVEWWWLAAVLAAGLLAGWLWGFLRRPTSFEVARAAEHRLGLKERLSSALALGARAPSDPLVAMLVDDAATRLAPVEPARLFPRRLGRRGHAFIGLVVLVAAAMVLPELPPFQSAATRAERAQMRRQGAHLQKLATELRKKPTPLTHRQIMAQLTTNMERLGKGMQAGRLTKKQSLVGLNKLSKQMALARQSVLGKGTKSLSAAAAELRTLAATQARQANIEARAAQQLGLTPEQLKKLGVTPEQAKKLKPEQVRALQKLAKELSKMPGGNSKTLQSVAMPPELAARLAELLAKDDMQEALRILREMAQQLGDQKALRKLSDAELKELARRLEELAKILRNTDLDALAAEMKRLAEALRRGDLKACKNCAGCLGCKCCLGLGLGGGGGFGAGFGLAGGMGGQGSGPGTAPGDGMSHYNPALTGQVHQGPASRIQTQHYDTRIQGRLGDKGEISSMQVMGAPDQPGQTQVPYYEVYSHYSKAAESALEREEVPAPYRQRVKSYFDSLRPESK